MADISIFSGERAAKYNSFVNRWIPGYEQLMKYIPGLISVNSNREVESVLVVGCGTGNELMAINDQQPSWKLMGIDPSPEMVVQARQLLTGRANVTIRDGRIENLSSELSYDAATLLLVLHFIPDDGSKLKLLQEIAARLKPGSPLVLIDIYSDRKNIDIQLQMLKGMLLSDVAGAEIDERLLAIKDRIQHISEDRLVQLVKQAGFAAIHRFLQAGIYGGWILLR